MARIGKLVEGSTPDRSAVRRARRFGLSRRAFVHGQARKGDDAKLPPARRSPTTARRGGTSSSSPTAGALGGAAAADQLRDRRDRRLRSSRRGQIARHAADHRLRRRHRLRHGAGRASDAPSRPSGRLHHRHADQRSRRGAFRPCDGRRRASSLLCVGSFLVGFAAAFVQQFRFAAADTASPAFRPRAISLVMVGGIVAAVLGPQTVIYAADLFESAPYAGAFLASAVLALPARSCSLFLDIPRDGREGRERRPAGRSARSHGSRSSWSRSAAPRRRLP